MKLAKESLLDDNIEKVKRHDRRRWIKSKLRLVGDSIRFSVEVKWCFVTATE